MNSIKYYLLVLLVSNALCFLFITTLLAQKTKPKADTTHLDTFFLAKKTGLLGKLGKSVAISDAIDPGTFQATKNVTPFASFKGKTIRCVVINNVSFGVSVNDTSQVIKNFLINFANRIHRQTQEKLIIANLFFREGDILNPNLIAENVRYLRSLNYLQDARIVVVRSKANKQQVDVDVFYKDVFSVGGAADVNGKAVYAELSDNNIMGTGQRLVIKNLYDLNRSPNYGWGAEYTKRNFAGSFANLSVGYQNLANAYSNGSRDEDYAYIRMTLPLVSPYHLWTGEAEIATHRNTNKYGSDSLYSLDNQYNYNNLDAWAGYNITNSRFYNDLTKRKPKQFLALRVIDQQFKTIPDKYELTYNPMYANLKGILTAYTFFKQEYYHTSYIYGFGRNEDVPEGYNASIIGGWTDKNDLERPYMGVNFEKNFFTKQKQYIDYEIKVGGYIRNHRFEDFSTLFNIETFTRLRKFNHLWYNRNFFSFSGAHQFNRLLDAPLILNSSYGIPQYSGDSSTLATTRGTFNAESVFYDTWKLAGFSFAPFAFTNFSFLKTESNYNSGSNLDGYAGFGLGVRTRNENLIFGTIELRLSYFPRTLGSMTPLNINVSSDLRYIFNSQYIKRPDFVVFN